MNRRSFFKKLGVGIAVAAVAPSALALMEPICVVVPAAYRTYVMGQDAVIGSYADYASFSDKAIATAIDEQVAATAAELGARAAHSIHAVHSFEFA